MTGPMVVTAETDLTSLDDAALATAVTEAPAPKPEGDKPPVSEPEKKDPPTAEPTNDAQPKDGQPKEGDPAPGNEPAPQPAQPDDKFVALEKRLADQEKFINRQAAEIGKLRKVAPPVDAEKIREEIKARFFEDPIQATRDLQYLDQAEAASKKEQVLAAIPGFDGMIEEMAAVAKSENVPDEIVDAFKRDPYRPPMDLLFTMASKARDMKGERDKKAEIDKVRAELEAQKKRSDEILARIDAAAKGGSLLSSKSGGDSGGEGIENLKPEQIADLSDDQLNELLKKE